MIKNNEFIYEIAFIWKKKIYLQPNRKKMGRWSEQVFLLLRSTKQLIYTCIYTYKSILRFMSVNFNNVQYTAASYRKYIHSE